MCWEEANEGGPRVTMHARKNSLFVYVPLFHCLSEETPSLCVYESFCSTEDLHGGGGGMATCHHHSLTSTGSSTLKLGFLNSVKKDVNGSCLQQLTDRISVISKSTSQCKPVRMTLVEERPVVSIPSLRQPSTQILAYELVQGALVKWSEVMDRSIREPPTAVLLHGILGCRRNWSTFAKRLAQEFPTWQFLLVDLRCHGDSASIQKRAPHTVAAAAQDVLRLVGQLKLTPRVLIGHSFGGKVALSMVDQAAKPLARPVQLWVLDATPGTVRAGGNGEDHPAELIEALAELRDEVPSRRFVINSLLKKGFSAGVAQWMTTNLRPVKSAMSPAFSWSFDLQGISDMYQSYETTNLWHIVENVPQGVHCNFLRAERSLHRWAHEDVQRIHLAETLAATEGAGVEMHVLEDAGHWVHADNPDGLFRILTKSFLGF